MFKIQKGYDTESKTFRLPIELISKLEALATSNNLSLNQLVIQCLNYAVDNLEGDSKQQTKVQVVNNRLLCRMILTSRYAIIQDSDVFRVRSSDTAFCPACAFLCSGYDTRMLCIFNPPLRSPLRSLCVEAYNRYKDSYITQKSRKSTGKPQEAYNNSCGFRVK